MFPLDQPGPTAFYLTLYLATFVLHLLPMAYVVAGAAVLLVRTLAGARPVDDPLAEHFRQWLPFILSVAITAGVAPLLFLQILYHREFYTANVLLFSRWMAILPVLVVGFYLLYLMKGDWLWQRPLVVRVTAAAVIFASFAFIGWSWSENHLLSTAGQAVWTEQYVAGRLNYLPGELWPRIGIWLSGVFPVMAAIVTWPLARGEDNADLSATASRLAMFAAIGLVVSLACIGWYLGVLEPAARTAVLDAPLRVWQAAFVVGAVLQFAAWILIWRAGRLEPLPRWLATAGALFMVAALAVGREAIRTSRLDMTALLPRHQAAAQVGGFWLFATFLVINFAAIAGCVYLVARYARPVEAERAMDKRRPQR
ncbi:MAG: hypothetical protein L0211_17800 [Planctomycetaceae bacterium]|nr:hypothetical protein [Planctomycetaceae bacterium]